MCETLIVDPQLKFVSMLDNAQRVSAYVPGEQKG
jgi:hypothetical protein